MLKYVETPKKLAVLTTTDKIIDFCLRYTTNSFKPIILMAICHYSNIFFVKLIHMSDCFAFKKAGPFLS